MRLATTTCCNGLGFWLVFGFCGCDVVDALLVEIVCCDVVLQ